MSQVRVVTDSLTDIPDRMQRALGIVSVPAIVHFGEQSFRDKVDLGPDEFYQRLATSPTLPTTSQPPPVVFEQVYRELSAETDQIVSIHSTSKLTGIYSSAVTASENVSNLRVVVVDSRSVTMSAGWLVILAARAARAGETLDEILRLLDVAVPRSHIIAMLDTLEYARRGGRLGRAQVLLGTLLNVKPILSLKEGEVEPVENVRTCKRAIERLAAVVLASGPIQELAVMHAAGHANAQRLKDLFAPHFDAARIVIGETGPVIGAHVGPNAVGACWISED